MFRFLFLSTALAATTFAHKLYVSSYTGAITSLHLERTNDGDYKLTELATDTHCSPNASWIHLDPTYNNLFCLDENIVGNNGSITSYRSDPISGVLDSIKHTATLSAPVNSFMYTSPNGSQLLAVAHYGHAVTTWRVDPMTAAFSPLDSLNLTIPAPGPNAARQAASHPHQVLVDPKNKYLVVPDLGGDKLHIFYIDPLTLRLSPRPAVPAPPGSGPRHGKFLRHAVNETFFYLVTELSSQLLTYRTTYLPNNGGLNLTIIGSGVSTNGSSTNATAWSGIAAAEIAISRNAKSLYVSNRNATVLKTTNTDPKNSTKIPSDTIAHFNIAHDGSPKFDELSPAGGSFPRNFALSGDGKMMAVTLQLSGRLAIFEVCSLTGRVGSKALATWENMGNVTSVVWGN